MILPLPLTAKLLWMFLEATALYIGGLLMLATLGLGFLFGVFCLKEYFTKPAAQDEP